MSPAEAAVISTLNFFSLWRYRDFTPTTARVGDLPTYSTHFALLHSSRLR